jgi:hypothetical protein
LLARRRFKMVVIDEATQATEPATLVPLTQGAECAVMAGDPCQLPPTITSRAAAQQFGLQTTLFERLQETGGLDTLLLDTQYRMHPAIAQFPRWVCVCVCVCVNACSTQCPSVSRWEAMRIAHVGTVLQKGSVAVCYRWGRVLRCAALYCAVLCPAASSAWFYRGALKDGVAAQDKPAAAGVAWPQQQQPVMVVAVQGLEERASRSSKGKVGVVLWPGLCAVGDRGSPVHATGFVDRRSRLRCSGP